MSAIKEHYHEKIETGQRSSKQHPIGWLNMPGYKPETWNPIVGCSKVSPGCDNCYAEKFAFRLVNMLEKSKSETYHVYQNAANKQGWTGRTALNTDHIAYPLRWKTPRMIFVCSMGDIFHEHVPFSWIDQVFDIITDCSDHIFIILTKRPERMKEYMDYRIKSHKFYGHSWVWLGVTVENQEQANKRIPILLSIPAEKRFVSVEPMLGPVDLKHGFDYGDEIAIDFLTGDYFTSPRQEEPAKDDNKLDWVICGGETGSNARPINQNWAIELKNQCKEANVPFFFKQWGEWEPRNSGSFALHNDPKSEKYPLKKVPYGDNPFEYSNVSKVGKKNAGNILDGQQYHEWPKN